MTGTIKVTEMGMGLGSPVEPTRGIIFEEWSKRPMTPAEVEKVKAKLVEKYKNKISL